MSTLKTNSTKEDELLIWCYIRQEFEQKYKLNVPNLIKYMILKFSIRFIPSSLMTLQEDTLFINSLYNQLKCAAANFKLVFKASEHEFSSESFHKYCDDISCNIVLVKSSYGNIFGGFTTQRWKNWSHDNSWYQKDKNAFIFLIRSDNVSVQNQCPIFFQLKHSEQKYAICSKPYAGPIFGGGWDFYLADKCDKRYLHNISDKKNNHDISFKKLCASKLSSYYNEQHPNITLCGGNIIGINDLNLFEVEEYEVFQVLY